MNRAEAEKLLGTKVSAWTAYRGVYAGELIRIIPARPFRAVIRVETICDLPDGNRANLILPGAELEVGGVNIRPVNGPLADYGTAIAALIQKETDFLNNWEAQVKADPDRPRTRWYHGNDNWVINQRREAVERFKTTNPFSSDPVE